VIGKLTGRIDSQGEDYALIDVGGVGYVAFCSARTLAGLPRAGEAAVLLIETHVREDHIHLYGFGEEAERAWFRLLTTVQGVGARMALAILGVLGPGDLAQAIAAQDKAALIRASGVGPKLAQRIVTELKDKAAGIALGPAAGFADANAALAASLGGADGAVVEDAISALVNLGYRRMEAFAAISRAQRDASGEPSLDTLIRGGLKELAS
jgi:Holliday junction DNA helicase RuvA